MASLAHFMRRRQFEHLAKKLAEKRRRVRKALHAQRGHYNAEGVWTGGLLSFVEDFWHILEPDQRFVTGWPLEAIAQHLEAVSFGEKTRLLLNVPPGTMKSLLTDVFFPAWIWSARRNPGKRFIAFSYSSSLTERDNERFSALLQSADFKAYYGHVFDLKKFGEKKVTNNKRGWKLASSVGGVGTGERGDIVILDDPHNVKESESDTIRKETVRWFGESMSDRLNDLTKGAIIVIMQRVHEEDVSGEILTKGLDYVHLSIPMEYVWAADEDGKPFENELGWSDPRWAADPEECDGDLMWPDRFPPAAVARLQKEKGPYAYCNPFEAPILMGDLSMKPIGEVRVGDDIVGFTIGNNEKRARLKPAKVLSISETIQPVVKMTFESGAVIRCTSDHKWWTTRNDASHAPYAKAKVGSTLSRVCPSHLPEILSAEDARLAGWLAGFFDGEGSVSVQKKKGGGFSTPLITFCQGDGRNGVICEKLEAVLDHFGFTWGVHKKSPAKRDQEHRIRMYWLKNGGGKHGGRFSRVGLLQRFLHIVQPVKWRDRIIELTVNSRLFTAAERVAKIEEDGFETVYGLETTTGNYVVWGLASSNSGQYQQTPEARGGGIIKREFWQHHDGKFPLFSYVVASLDSSFAEKELNDPSALTIWGIFQNEYGHNRAMLIFGFRKLLQFEGMRLRPDKGENQKGFMERQMREWGLVEWTYETCKRWKVDHLLIEGKASGISAAQAMRKRYSNARFSIQLVNPEGDKVARALAVQSTFSNRMVYAPTERDWCVDLIDEAAVFPNGKHDDYTDSTTQAIKHLRDMNLLELDEDVRAEEIANVRLDAVKAKADPILQRYGGVS